MKTYKNRVFNLIGLIVTLAMVISAFGMASDHESAAAPFESAAAPLQQAVPLHAAQSDFALATPDRPMFTLISTDGQEVYIPRAMVMEDFRQGQPLAPLLKHIFSHEFKEKKENGTRVDMDGETLEIVTSCLEFMHEQKESGINVEDKEIYTRLINNVRKVIFNDQLTNLEKTTTSLELLRLAELYDIPFLKDVCIPLIKKSFCATKAIQDFLAHPDTYQKILSEIPSQIKTTIDSDTFDMSHSLAWHKGAINCTIFSPDSQSIISSSEDNNITIWIKDANSGHFMPYQTLKKQTRLIALSADGQALINAYLNNITLFKKDTHKTFDPKSQGSLKHKAQILCLAISPNDQYIASGSGHESHPFDGIGYLTNGPFDCTINVWTPSNPTPQILKGHTGWVSCLAFSPDNQQLASGSWDRTVKIWTKNNTTNQFSLTQTFEMEEDIIRAIAFSPDGKKLAITNNNNIALVTRNPDGTFNPEPHILRGHTNAIYSLAFSPNSKQLASGSSDKTIRIWTEDQGIFNPAPHILDDHTSTIFSLMFSPDNQYLVSGSGASDRTIKVWRRGQQPMIASIPQAMFITAIKQSPSMILDLREATEANSSLREIALSLINTKAEEYVREHVRMPWPVAATTESTQAGPAPIESAAAKE